MSTGDKELVQRLVLTVERLKKENDELLKQKSGLETSIDGVKKEISSIQEQLRAETEEQPMKDKLKQEKDNLQQKVEDLEGTYERLQQSIAEMKKACESAVYKLCEERQKLANAEKKKDSVLSDLQKLISYVKQLQSQPSPSQRLQMAKDSYQNLKDSWRKEKQQLKSGISLLDAELAKADESKKNETLRLEGFKKRIEELEGKIDRRNEAISELEESNQEIDENIESLRKSGEEFECDCESIQKVIDSLNIQRAKEVAASAEALKTYESEKGRLNDLKAGMAKVQRSIDMRSQSLRKQIEEEMQKVLEDTKTEASTLVAQVGEASVRVAEAEKQRVSSGALLGEEEATVRSQMEQFSASSQKIQSRFSKLKETIVAFSLPK